MRDYEEKSFYEIQLDNKQLILVFLAAVTVCVLIFVLGVMIGKGQKEAEFAAAARNQKNTAPAEPDNNAPTQALSDVTSDKSEEAKSTPPPEPVQEKPSPPEQTAKQIAKQTAPPAPDPEKAKEKPKQKYAYEDLDKPEEPAAAPKKEPEPAKTAAKGTEQAEESTSAGNSKYTVQVIATSSRPKAEEQISRLKSKGYKPFLDETSSGDTQVFKVRVGRFVDTKDAKELASKIKSDTKLETWVAVLD